MTSRLHQAALRTLQAGALAAVLAAAPYKLFDLDRFFVPKELVLALAALVAGALCISRARSLTFARSDELLAVALMLTTLSAALATNRWIAERSLAIALGGASCFWSARALRTGGASRALVAALSFAGIVGAATALVQAYGLRLEYFSLNRAPGGTFGNRNFMAHLSVIALPAIVFSGLRAPSRAALMRWCAGLALIGGALTLSRSRAAWLGMLGGFVVLVVAGFTASRRRDDSLALSRAWVLLLALFAGAGAALVIPNTLDWRSDSPYLETAQGLVNYKGGSGHGRLVQYGNSLRMTLRHPLLGVGPGNWAVTYPRFASTNDPSLSRDGMTSNPWPSSDWVAFFSERGPLAAGALALALLALFADGVRGLWREAGTEERLASAVFLATLVTLLIVGLFDAVLLLPAPALVGWSLLGGLAPSGRKRRTIGLTTTRRLICGLVIVAVGGAAAWRSASQLAAMSIYQSSTKLSVLERAAQLDPGSYRIRVRLAQGYSSRGDCTRARPHALAARDLFPNSPTAKSLASACGAAASGRP